jgi:MFS family permease
MKTSAFWLISFGHGSALLVVGALMVHLIPHLVDRMDMSLGSAALVVTVMTTTSIFGQVGGGFLGDRMDKRLISAACMLAHTVALIGIAYASSLLLIYVFAVIHGLAWGTRGPLMGAIRADYFGRKSLPTIMGFSSLIITVGNVVGPVFAGFMADWQGDYQMGFVILAVLTGLGTVFFLAAKKPAPPPRVIAQRPTVDEG